MPSIVFLLLLPHENQQKQFYPAEYHFVLIHQKFYKFSKMMKKIFVFVMLMVFAFSLTACSGTATPSAEKDSLTIQEWLDNEGSEADTTMTVTIVAIENPVWALVTDSSGAEVHLFGVMVDGEHKAFGEAGISEGDTIVISGGKYNEFEGNVEIAEATLVEIKQ